MVGATESVRIPDKKYNKHSFSESVALIQWTKYTQYIRVILKKV